MANSLSPLHLNPFQPDPNDAGSRNNVSSVVLSNNARNSRNNTGNEMVLTEEEMAFMNEHLAGSSSPGDSDTVGDRVRLKVSHPLCGCKSPVVSSVVFSTSRLNRKFKVLRV